MLTASHALFWSNPFFPSYSCMVLLSYWHEENLGGSHTHFMVAFLFFSPSFVNNPKRTLSNGKARVKWEIVRNQSSERLFMVAIKCKRDFCIWFQTLQSAYSKWIVCCTVADQIYLRCEISFKYILMPVRWLKMHVVELGLLSPELILGRIGMFGVLSLTKNYSWTS